MAKFSSRLARFEEKKLQNRLIFALIGSLLVVTFLVVFGFNLFINFFVFLDQMRGKETPAKETTSALVIPPYLDPLPAATGSGKLILSGRGQKETTVVIYVDSEETKKIKVGEDGTFSINTLNLSEGSHTVQAKTADDKGKLSEFSNTLTTFIKKKPPILEVTNPSDNSTVNGEDNLIAVQGRTEEENDVRVNDRYVVVSSNGSFSYPFPLADGENILTIKAIDRAGNVTQMVRKVTYQK